MTAILLLVLLLAILAGAALGTILMRHRQRLEGPVCGRCGYRVTGLPGWICPECGSDFREVGIRAPGMYGPMPLLWKGIGWTLIIVLVAVSTLTIAPRQMPQVYTETRSTNLPKPSSKAYKGVDVETFGCGYRQPTAPEKLSFRLNTLGSASQPANSIAMQISLPDFTCKHEGRNEATLGELTPQRILDWMADSGIDIQGPHVRTEADELLRLANQFRKGRNLGDAGMPPTRAMSAGAHPPAWTVPTLIAVWLVVWAVGLWYIRHTRQKSTAQDRSQNP